MKKGIIAILTVSLILRLFLLFQNHAVWWDASIYLGMGKALFSNYHIGIWEPLRPILWPLALGFLWKVGLDPIFFGNILQIILSLGIIYLTYLIARHHRNENEALIAAAIIAFTPVFLEFNFRLYTEIPSVFLGLLAIYLLRKEKYASSGFLTGLSFLTKFPSGIVIIIQTLFTEFKRIKYLIFGFLTAIIPYFIYNYFKYNDAFLPIKEGKYIIQYAGIWLFQQSWDFYLKEFLRQNFFYIFAIIGIFLIFKKRTAIIPLTGIALLAYFSLEPHKEPRFMILFLPYFAIMAAYGISKIKIKNIALIVAIVSLAFLVLNLQSELPFSKAETEFNNFGFNDTINGEVLTSTPMIKLADKTKVTPIYYMVFDANLSNQWNEYIEKNYENISYIFIDTCIGGTICPPWDKNCNEARDSLMNTSEKLMPKHFYLNENNCEYHVFYR